MNVDVLDLTNSEQRQRIKHSPLRALPFWLDLTNSEQRQRIKHRPLRALPFEPSVLFDMAVGLRSLDP